MVILVLLVAFTVFLAVRTRLLRRARRPALLARIRLLRSPNVGPVSYAQLLRRFR